MSKLSTADVLVLHVKVAEPGNLSRKWGTWVVYKVGIQVGDELAAQAVWQILCVGVPCAPVKDAEPGNPSHTQVFNTGVVLHK